MYTIFGFARLFNLADASDQTLLELMTPRFGRLALLRVDWCQVLISTTYRNVGMTLPVLVRDGEYKANLLGSANGVFMFTDLFHIIHSLDHDFKEENGKQADACGCRCCQLSETNAMWSEAAESEVS